MDSREFLKIVHFWFEIFLQMMVSFILQNWMVSSFVSPHTHWFFLGVFSKTRKLAAFREIEMFLGEERRNSQKLFNLSYF